MLLRVLTPDLNFGVKYTHPRYVWKYLSSLSEAIMLALIVDVCASPFFALSLDLSTDCSNQVSSWRGAATLFNTVEIDWWDLTLPGLVRLPTLHNISCSSSSPTQISSLSLFVRAGAPACVRPLHQHSHLPGHHSAAVLRSRLQQDL
jgi:hypothetical protein